MLTTSEAASPLPLKGAEARGSKPTCVGLDRPRNGRVSRPCGLQGTLADRQSRIRGGCLEVARRGPDYFGPMAPAAGQSLSPTRWRVISKKRCGSRPGAMRSPTSRSVPSLIAAV